MLAIIRLVSMMNLRFSFTKILAPYTHFVINVVNKTVLLTALFTEQKDRSTPWLTLTSTLPWLRRHD